MTIRSMKSRRTIRKYTDEKVADEELRDLLLAAMYAPSAWGKRSWEFVVVDDENLRKELSTTTSYSAQVASAPVTIVIMSNKELSNSWVEDASIAAEHINLEAAKLGLGSSWIQVRGMKHNATDAEAYVKELLNIPGNFGVCCMITVGHAAEEKSPHREGEYEEEKVHYNKYGGRKMVA